MTGIPVPAMHFIKSEFFQLSHLGAQYLFLLPQCLQSLQDSPSRYKRPQDHCLKHFFPSSPKLPCSIHTSSELKSLHALLSVHLKCYYMDYASGCFFGPTQLPLDQPSKYFFFVEASSDLITTNCYMWKCSLRTASLV